MHLSHISGVYRFPLVLAEKQRMSLFYVDFKVAFRRLIILKYYSNFKSSLLTLITHTTKFSLYSTGHRA